MKAEGLSAMCALMLVAAPAAWAETQQREEQQGMMRGEQSGQQQSSRQQSQQGSAMRQGQQGETESDARASMMRPIQEDAQQEIRALLADVVDSSVNLDVESIVDNFTEADRERFANVSQDQFSALQSDFDRLQSTVEQRYGEEIDFDSSAVRSSVFDFQMAQGAAPKTVNVIIPGQQGMQGGTLKLRDEGVLTTAWRIDVPDNFDAQQLQSSLRKHVQMIRDLPASQDAGGKVIAQHLLLAVSGADVAKGQKSGQGSEQPRAQMGSVEDAQDEE